MMQGWESWELVARGAPPSSKGTEACVHRGSCSLRVGWKTLMWVSAVGLSHTRLSAFLIRVHILSVKRPLLTQDLFRRN